MAEFTLPEIGEGVLEGEIVEWHVSPGDKVKVDQPLVSVLTDKATVEIAATFEGEIGSLAGESGDIINVGAVLLTYQEEGGEAPKSEPAPKNNAEAEASQAKAEKKPGKEGAIYEFPLPEIGEGVLEGEIVEWHVAVGDTVTQDTPVVSVLTDKATVEIAAPVDGAVTEILGEPGDIVEVGAILMKIQTSDEVAAAAPAVEEVKQDSKPAKTAEPASAATEVSPEVDPKDNPSISKFGTPLATPAVRRLAAQHKVDLRAVRGSGPNHRILRADVERALAAPKAAPSQETAPAAAVPVSRGGRREKIKGMRRAILQSMTKSKRIIPHFTYVDEVEMDELVAIRERDKAYAAEQNIKLTYLPFIVKAVVLALKKFPIMNASVDDEAGEMVYHGDYNIGIATATEAGLTVPVLKHADQKTLLDCAREIAELTDRARKRRATMEDLSDGTFTITSLGRLGGLLATPIINHPEVGILGIHNLQDRAVVRNGQIVARKMMNISLSFDHRVVDGDVGATFAQEVKSYLEDPGKLLLHLT